MGRWQFDKKVTVANGTPAVTRIPVDQPLLWFTVWINSGKRSLVNASFELLINGVAYNPAVAIAGRQAADPLYSSGGATSENDMIPYVSLAAAANGIDPFDIDVRSTNNDAAATMDVTIHALGDTVR